MTTPESEDPRRQERHFDDGEVDREFESIVSGIVDRMAWDVDQTQLDDTAEQVAEERRPVTGPEPTTPPVTGQIPDATADETADERRQRREERRAARAEEYAEFQAAEAERQNELLFDDDHYVPPEPPPIGRPRARTIWAFVLIFAGVFLMAGPNLLAISGEATLILGILLVVAGFVMLMLGLPRHHGEPGEGWDDGAKL